MTVTKTIIDKFDRNVNFAMWRIKMETILVQNKCEQALHGIEKKPSDMTFEEFEELDLQAKSEIVLHLSDRVLKEVATETIAKGMWDALKGLYMKKTMENRFYLKQKLYSLRMTEDSSDGKKLNKHVVILPLSISLVLLGLVILLCNFQTKRRRPKMKHVMSLRPNHNKGYLHDQKNGDTDLPFFELSRLVQATNNFSSGNKVG